MAQGLKSETSFLRKDLMRLSEECVEFENENKSITVHHLNPYFLISPFDLSGLFKTTNAFIFKAY